MNGRNEGIDEKKLLRCKHVGNPYDWYAYDHLLMI